jgi:hypothetical protein
MKKDQAEPLIELFYQEFPNKDPPRNRAHDKHS